MMLIFCRVTHSSSTNGLSFRVFNGSLNLVMVRRCSIDQVEQKTDYLLIHGLHYMHVLLLVYVVVRSLLTSSGNVLAR